MDTDLPQSGSGSTVIIRHLPAEKIAKLRSELDMVHINLDVFEQMLSELDPGNENQQDWQLLIVGTRSIIRHRSTDFFLGFTSHM